MTEPTAVADAPAPAPPRPRRRWLPVVVALGALAVLAIGAVVAVRGLDARNDADRELARARARLVAARPALRQATADRAAVHASVQPFAGAAGTATDAGAHVVELERALVDRLTRLHAAGSQADARTYNQIVAELNATSDDLVTAFAGLEPPLAAFSRALEDLPTIRCTAPVSRTGTWTRYGDSGLQCARLRVPLDYARPDGPQIVVTAVKRPADDPASRIGPLVINPGGPGASGIAFLRQATLTMPPEVLRRFDLVGFDPRGVGRSTPVDCGDSLDPMFDLDLTAPDPATRDAGLAAAANLVRGCTRRSGALLEHVDTSTAAHDMDRLRVALGVDRLNYLGYSYGTFLGARYADLFPEHVRTAVLDGAVHPERSENAAGVADPSAFASALDAALGFCAANRTCAFATGRDPSREYDALMRRLVTAPLTVGNRKLGRTQAELGVVSGLYRGAEGWPELLRALARADAGDGSGLFDLADRYTGRRADGSFNNEMAAHYAINCVDLGGRLTPQGASDAVHALPDDPGRFRAVSVLLALPCAYWPAPRVELPPSPLDAAGSPPILVIGGAHDPATPIAGAEALARTLRAGVLLRFEGSGHTAFGRGNHCVDDAVVAYLVEQRPPANDTSCPGT